VPDVLVSRRGGQIIPLLILLAFRRTSTINIAVVLGQRWCPRGRPAGCKSTDGRSELTREQKVMWIQHQIQASRDIEPPTRDELVEVLGRLQGMDSDDTKAIPGWETIKTRAPRRCGRWLGRFS
jgi:hypothetical protein